MHRDLVRLLRCPLCGGILDLAEYAGGETPDDVASGLLICSCNAKFPIWRSVPRMLVSAEDRFPQRFIGTFENQLRTDAPEHVLERNELRASRNYSFDLEWSMYQYGDLTWELDLPTRVKYAYEYLKLSPGSMKSKVVLDAGCGNGTLSAALAASGLRVVAMDYSASVERAESEKKRFASAGTARLDYVQGDLQYPPFAPGSFDAIYCDGVLHHTPSTRHSFESVASLVKEPGRMFVWLYRSDLRPLYKIKSAAIKRIRSAMRPIPQRVVKRLCYAGAVLLQARLRAMRALGVNMRRVVPVWLKAVNLYDTFTPRHNHQHTPSEVAAWFRDVGFGEVVETTKPILGHMGFGLLGMRHAKSKEAAQDSEKSFVATVVS